MKTQGRVAGTGSVTQIKTRISTSYRTMLILVPRPVTEVISK